MFDYFCTLFCLINFVSLLFQDASGTVNSFEEATQMTTNLCFGFKFDMISEQVLSEHPMMSSSDISFECRLPSV